MRARCGRAWRGSAPSMPTIAVDAMGGDHAPDAVVQGVAQISLATDIECLLVGDERRIQSVLEGVSYNPEHIAILHASEAIGMAEEPREAVKRRDASLLVGVRAVAEGRAEAFVSAGNTGACVLACAKHFRLLRGIRRAALASVYPRHRARRGAWRGGSGSACSRAASSGCGRSPTTRSTAARQSGASSRSSSSATGARARAPWATRSRWPPRRCATTCRARSPTRWRRRDEARALSSGGDAARVRRAAPLPLGPRQDLPAQRVRLAALAPAHGVRARRGQGRGAGRGRAHPGAQGRGRAARAQRARLLRVGEPAADRRGDPKEARPGRRALRRDRVQGSARVLEARQAAQPARARGLQAGRAPARPARGAARGGGAPLRRRLGAGLAHLLALRGPRGGPPPARAPGAHPAPHPRRPPPGRPHPAARPARARARLRRDPGPGRSGEREERMRPEDFVVVLVTAGNAEEAARIGGTLVVERLAACANVVGPIHSVYRWQGAVEEAAEHLLLVKARAADLPALEARVRALHSYQVPEVVALRVTAGSAPYLAWLAESTARDA